MILLFSYLKKEKWLVIVLFNEKIYNIIKKRGGFMIKRLREAFCFILFMSVIFTGCSNSSNSLKDENIALSKEVSTIKEENVNLEKTVKDLNDKLSKQEPKNNIAKEPSIKDKSNLYPIYTADTDTYKKQIDAYIYIPKELELKQKLDTLAKALSEAYFDNLPIQVVNIKDVDNKKVAVINLDESSENQGISDFSKLKGSTWATKYFQGSTGGTITSTQLIETMLQRDYSGQWIDGVKFLYKNKDCNFQHVPDLCNINYRK